MATVTRTHNAEEMATVTATPATKPAELLLYLGVTMDDLNKDEEQQNGAKRPRLAQTDRTASTDSTGNGPALRRVATMQDTTGDGRADLLFVDTTGDGRPDRACESFGVDTTGDVRTDTLIADTTGDGLGDSLVMHTTGDGMPDTVVPAFLVDTTGDGQPDMAMVDDDQVGNDTIVNIYGAEPSKLNRIEESPGAAPS